MTNSDLEATISAVLGAHGYRERKGTWRKANDDTITLVNLQKSQWGGQYYINLGIYLRDLGKAASPAEHQCHIRIRIDALAGERRAALEAALDLEKTGFSDSARRAVIEGELREIAVPFLTERSTLPQLRELRGDGTLGPVFCLKAARDLLDEGAASAKS